MNGMNHFHLEGERDSVAYRNWRSDGKGLLRLNGRERQNWSAKALIHIGRYPPRAQKRQSGIATASKYSHVPKPVAAGWVQRRGLAFFGPPDDFGPPVGIVLDGRGPKFGANICPNSISSRSQGASVVENSKRVSGRAQAKRGDHGACPPSRSWLPELWKPLWRALLIGKIGASGNSAQFGVVHV